MPHPRITQLTDVVLSAEPFDLTTEDGRAKERLRRAAWTTLASLAAKGLAMLTNLITIPLTLRYLGAERFGLWVTITSANQLLEFADLGLGNGLLNIVVSAGARGEHSELRKYVSSATFLLAAIAFAGALGFYAVSPLLPWQNLFGAGSVSLAGDARAACGAFAVCFAASLPLGLVRRVQMGYQEGFSSNLWQCLASVLTLVALLAAIQLRAGLPVLVLGLMGAPAVALAMNWLYEFAWKRPWLLPSPREARWSAGWRLVRDGLLFVTLQICALSMTAPDPLIAASYVGLSEAGAFAVTQRLFVIVFLMQAMWLMPLWPAYGEAMARNDATWARRTLMRTTIIAVVSSAVASLVLIAFRAPIYSAWLHRDWAAPLALSAGLGLSTVLLSAGTAISMYLNGINAIREQAGISVLLTAVVFGLKIAFARWFGTTGIPWALAVGYIAVMTPFFVATLRGRLAPRAHSPSGSSSISPARSA